MLKLIFFTLLLSVSQAEIGKTFRLKPLSACCDIPELSDAIPLAECRKSTLPGPCNNINCAFEKFGFLIDQSTLNKEAYKSHLRKWTAKHEQWSEAIEKAIRDCVDVDIRQYLNYPCKAYDVFTCTEIAILKKCPENSWTC